MRNTIFVLFGEEGVGKKTLLLEAIKFLPKILGHVPVTTTEKVHDFYKKLLPEIIESSNEAAAKLIHSPDYLFSARSGSHYTYIMRSRLNMFLGAKMGIMIMSEESLKRFRKIGGYEIVPVYVQASYRQLTDEQKKRIRAAEVMEKRPRMRAKKTLTNNFKKGPAHAAKLLVQFIRGYAT